MGGSVRFLGDWGPRVQATGLAYSAALSIVRIASRIAAGGESASPRPCDNADGPAENRQGPWFGSGGLHAGAEDTKGLLRHFSPKTIELTQITDGYLAETLCEFTFS